MRRQVLLLASASVAFGSVWDVAWASSIGPHTFRSPPHLLINVGGLLAVGAALSELLRGGDRLAILSLLGGLAVLAAEVALQVGGPDVMAGWGPVRILLAVGMLSVVGATAMAWARVGAEARLACVASFGLLLLMMSVVVGEYCLPNLQRTALFVQIVATAFPAILVMAARCAPVAVGATAAAATYMTSVLACVWFFPLFPATPTTEPVLQPVDYLLPPRFPLLLIVPALAIDYTRSQLGDRGYLEPFAYGLVFLMCAVPVQWYFSAFLLAPASSGWFFAGGAAHWPYYLEIGSERAVFWGLEESPLTIRALCWAGVYAICSSLAGYAIARRVEAS